MMYDIRDLHLGQGYSDWAYNKAVCHHNAVMDMRGPNRISGANGTTAANQGYGAVVALCDGRVDPIDDNTKRAFLRAHSEMPGRNGTIEPHSRFFNTGCPWDPIRDWIYAGTPITGGPELDAAEWKKLEGWMQDRDKNMKREVEEEGQKIRQANRQHVNKMFEPVYAKLELPWPPPDDEN